MAKARKAIASGKMLLQAGDIDGACNRAYYAMFYGAHAALDVAQAIAPVAVFKTHHGLIAVFSKELVLTGRVDKALGRALSKVYDMRLLADYEGRWKKWTLSGRSNKLKSFLRRSKQCSSAEDSKPTPPPSPPPPACAHRAR